MIVTARSEMDKWVMWNFLRERKVRLPISEEFQAIGRTNAAGDLIGVVAYEGFVGRVCSMHDAGEGNWLSRDFLRAVFDYPFNQRGLVMVLATVPASNAKALRLNERVGFRYFAKVEGGWEDGGDLLILAMRRDECRWIAEQRMAA